MFEEVFVLPTDSRRTLLPDSTVDVVHLVGGKVGHCTLRDAISSHHWPPLLRRVVSICLLVRVRTTTVVAMRRDVPAQNPARTTTVVAMRRDVPAQNPARTTTVVEMRRDVPAQNPQSHL
jgi:hypothetical protein